MSKRPIERPTYRSTTSRYLDMKLLLADARATSPNWMLAYSAAPHATYTAIQGGRHRDLRALTDGRLEAEIRQTYIEGGQRRGDIYVRFVPNEQP